MLLIHLILLILSHMDNILNFQEVHVINRNKKTDDKVVLVGGCFDVLHKGHIEFLKRSKAAGDILVLMLESDQKIKDLKGSNRPINTQEDRATVLANLSMVDYVICLPYLKTDNDYEMLVKSIKPGIIAVTTGAIVFDWERVYMNETGGKIVEVVKRIADYSTTKLVRR